MLVLVLVSLRWTFVVRTLRKLAFGAQRADGGELPGVQITAFPYFVRQGRQHDGTPCLCPQTTSAELGSGNERSNMPIHEQPSRIGGEGHESVIDERCRGMVRSVQLR
jgi:hypothetical protein